ncbi:hypothetical protein [Arthrobacter bambusae]|uniref:PknH-like extracellular domain-containing protein n=1 Tax=Arthrobacter bambusae TaxID=1338426 RepID=A0AAW8D5V8_9MICC|nr:hypothetical protein [Arthrobacter bambusae]MDP9903263.1 hypothetical protein [Arthrobacter bambusae]MDQ0128743.1 hypothetical protein [Arthrobacter bambusae]MDQ0180084.1 hypothetical protein [Arthrobacter bambusae]
MPENLPKENLNTGASLPITAARAAFRPLVGIAAAALLALTGCATSTAGNTTAANPTVSAPQESKARALSQSEVDTIVKGVVAPAGSVAKILSADEVQKSKDLGAKVATAPVTTDPAECGEAFKAASNGFSSLNAGTLGEVLFTDSAAGTTTVVGVASDNSLSEDAYRDAQSKNRPTLEKCSDFKMTLSSMTVPVTLTQGAVTGLKGAVVSGTVVTTVAGKPVYTTTVTGVIGKTAVSVVVTATKTGKDEQMASAKALYTAAAEKVGAL